MILRIKDLIDPDLFREISNDPHGSWERYILSEYKDQFKLNEGLILTQPVYNTLAVLDKSGFKVVQPENTNIFHVIVDEDSDVDKLLKITNNLGWFPSAVNNSLLKNFDKFTPSNLRSLIMSYNLAYIRFEAKYDIEVNLHGVDYLYHFTRKIYLPKILKNGLMPKTTSKLSHHPDRVYFTYTIHESERFANKFVNRIVPKNIEKTYPKEHNDSYLTGVILKVNVDMIPHYFKVFDDPNYHRKGCFTLNTIPPVALKVIKEFSLNY